MIAKLNCYEVFMEIKLLFIHLKPMDIKINFEKSLKISKNLFFICILLRGGMESVLNSYTHQTSQLESNRKKIFSFNLSDNKVL